MGKNKKSDWLELAKIFNQATSLSLTIALFPILFLVLGFFIDKKLNTTPIFIILGIIIGSFVGITRGVKIGKKILIK